MMNRTPFARSLALMATMQALMSAGASMFSAAAQSGADQYRSRGKGGKGHSMVRTQFYRSCNHYPFSSAKQNRKAATTQHMVTVNGFPLMQTRRSADRLSMSQVG